LLCFDNMTTCRNCGTTCILASCGLQEFTAYSQFKSSNKKKFHNKRVIIKRI
jgi:hypothetical protein